MPYRTTAYRYPNETLVLWLTIILVILVIAITATATICVSGIFVVLMLVFSYTSSRSQHDMLLQRATQVSEQTVPGMGEVILECTQRLQVEPVDIFVVSNRTLNAYTFGLATPKAVVLHNSLFRIMDRGEIQFILGHEMGHVVLGHTWLNSLIGGMAGIPAPYAASYILALIFRWWNRSCEYSADRAGLLACDNPAKAVSALIKLEAGNSGISSEALERALQKIQAEDDDPLSSLVELTDTHPMIIKRIEQIRQYAATNGYKQIQISMNKNLVL
jgi:Zn-dependent protease with chaperone function